jgi:ABC-type multidrug transport system, ATPase and permease components
VHKILSIAERLSVERAKSQLALSLGLWPRIKRSMIFMRPYRLQLGASVVLIVAGTAISLALPLGIRALLDTALRDRDASLLHILAGVLLALFLVRSLLSFIGSYVLQVTGERITVDLRRQLFDHLHKLDFLYTTNRRTGDLANRVVGDTTYIRTLVSEQIVTSVIQVVQLLGAVAIMVTIDLRLSLLVLVLAPATTALSHIFGPRMRQVSRELQDQVARGTSMVFESLSGMHVVKTFGRTEYESIRFASALERVAEVYKQSVRLQSAFRGITGLLTTMSSISIFWYGGVQVLGNRLSAGDLVAFLFYSQVITASLGQLAQVYSSLNASVGSADRVFEVFDATPSVKNSPHAIEPHKLHGHIRFENVSFTYEGRQPTLHNVSFDVEPGEVLALVGPSGGGKTTIVHLLLRLFDPSAGRILLDGHDLRNIRLEWLWKHCAVVAQDVFLFGMSVRENIRYGRLDATDEEVEAAARAAQAHEFITQLPAGYDTEIGERGARLSGGQKQRIAIARAFLKNAPILVLDEATSHVDAASEQLIQETIERLVKGRTTIVVAHRLSTVRSADRILVIQNGCIVEAGRHDELLEHGHLYHRLIESQAAASA